MPKVHLRPMELLCKSTVFSTQFSNKSPLTIIYDKVKFDIPDSIKTVASELLNLLQD